MTDTLTFVSDLPASVSTGRKGRPSLFTPALQAQVKAKPGVWAVLQENVKGRSRATALKSQFGEQGFEFRNVVTGHAERVSAKSGETVTDEIVTVYVRATATETTEDAPKATPRARGAKAPKA